MRVAGIKYVLEVLAVLAVEDTAVQELHRTGIVAGEAEVGYSLAVVVHTARMEAPWYHMETAANSPAGVVPEIHRATESRPEELEMPTDKWVPSKTVESLDKAIEEPNKLRADPEMVREPACLEGPTEARRLDTVAAAAAAKSDTGTAERNPDVAEADSRVGYNKVAT